MKQGTIIIYWGPVGALVYFFLTTNDRARIDAYDKEHEIL